MRYKSSDVWRVMECDFNYICRVLALKLNKQYIAAVYILFHYTFSCSEV